TVEGLLVAVVAALGAFDDAVAALGGRAHAGRAFALHAELDVAAVVATVARGQVAVVAALARGDDAVTAARDFATGVAGARAAEAALDLEAIRGTAVARRRIAVVASLVAREIAVAAA